MPLSEKTINISCYGNIVWGLPKVIVVVGIAKFKSLIHEREAKGQSRCVECVGAFHFRALAIVVADAGEKGALYV